MRRRSIGVLAAAESSPSESEKPAMTMSEADIEEAQLAMHAAKSTAELQASFAAAYKAAKAVGDLDAATALKEFYDVRKQTLAESEKASA